MQRCAKDQWRQRISPEKSNVEGAFMTKAQNDKWTKTNPQKLTNEHNSEDNFNWDLPLVTFGLIVSVAALVILHIGQEQNHTTKQQITCNIHQLEQKFPNQEKQLWQAIQIGVDSVLNKPHPKPSIFLFVYNDSNTMNRFTDKLLPVISNCFHTNEALVLNKSVLSSADVRENYGRAVEIFGPQLEQKGVMLVSDLNTIPADTARIFHVFCDKESPLVDRSVIFMTMTDLPRRTDRILVDAENYLRHIWRELRSNILNPLITRITDQVMFIESENHF